MYVLVMEMHWILHTTVHRKIFAPFYFLSFRPVVSGQILNWTNFNITNYLSFNIIVSVRI